MPSDTFLCVTIHGASFTHIYRCVSAIMREIGLYRYKYLSTKDFSLYLEIAAFYAKISLLRKMFKDHIATDPMWGWKFYCCHNHDVTPWIVSTSFGTSTVLSIFVSHRHHYCRSGFVYHVWNTDLSVTYLFRLHGLCSDVNIQTALRYLIVSLLWCFSESEIVASRWNEYCENRGNRQCVSPAYTEYWLVQIGYLWKERKYAMRDMKRIRMRKSAIRKSEESENK
jgi:hypothetical protein